MPKGLSALIEMIGGIGQKLLESFRTCLESFKHN